MEELKQHLAKSIKGTWDSWKLKYTIESLSTQSCKDYSCKIPINSELSEAVCRIKFDLGVQVGILDYTETAKIDKRENI